MVLIAITRKQTNNKNNTGVKVAKVTSNSSSIALASFSCPQNASYPKSVVFPQEVDPRDKRK